MHYMILFNQINDNIYYLNNYLLYHVEFCSYNLEVFIYSFMVLI